MIKKCRYCNKEFVAISKLQKNCDDCNHNKNKMWKENNKINQRRKYEENENYRKRTIKSVLNYIKNNKSKIEANYQRNKFKYKIRSKTLQKIKKSNECLHCRSKDRLQFHHITYKVNDIITLCSKCHGKLHRKN